MALDPEEGQQRHGRHDEPADAEHEEVPEAVDVVHEPAEVLAEEPGHERPGEEERARDGRPGGHRVQAVGVRVEVRAGQGHEVVVLALERPRDLREVVAHVAQVGARAVGEARQVQDRVGDRAEHVALAHHEAVELVDLLLEAVRVRELVAPGAVEHGRLEGVDAGLERVHGRVERVREHVEDAVDEELLLLGALGHQELVELVQGRAGLAAHGEDEGA